MSMAAGEQKSGRDALGYLVTFGIVPRSSD